MSILKDQDSEEIDEEFSLVTRLQPIDEKQGALSPMSNVMNMLKD